MSLKVHRIVKSGVTYVNMYEVDIKRLDIYIHYQLNIKTHEGIAEIYAFIFENFNKPEWYIVQYYGNEFIVQRLGK